MLKNYEIVFLIEAFILSFFIAFALCLFIIKYSKQKGILLDKDSVLKPQKVHIGDIPRAGGVGIFIAISVGILLGYQYGYVLFILPLSVIFLSGLLEDLHNSLSPKKRLFLQIIGVLIAIVLFDCVIVNIDFTLPYYMGVVFSVFCIVGIINAINIIDGFNGLAGGYSILTLLSIAAVSYIVGDKDILYLCVISIGAILGFMLLNFPNGNIFLGDGGAYLIGFMLAFLLIKLTQNQTTIAQYNISAWYGLCIMIHPVFEVLFSMWRRKILRNTSAMQPDKMHYHTLVYKQITHSNYKTSIVIWGLNMPFLILGIFFYNQTFILISLIFLFIIIYLYTYFKKLIKKRY